MARSTPFRLNRSGLMLALISAAFANQAGAAAGRTEFTIGGVTVAGSNGVQRPLARGTELDNGDVVRTNNGRAQIRFTDGSYVSLQPNTEFGIRDYRYEQKADGNERGFFGLLKGAMRTVTGAIGRINRDRYQIATPTATVGIRGTGGVIQVQDDGSTLVIGTSGIWSLTNPSGSVDVPAGTSALAPTDPNQPPQETTQQPASGPAPLPEEEPIFVAGNQVDESGNPIIPPPSLTLLMSGDGYAAVVAYTAFGSVNIDGGEGGLSSVSAVFNSAGQLTELTDSFSGTWKLDPATGQHADFGTDGILAWGRWTGDLIVPAFHCEGICPENYTANQGFHYVIGVPTATMPTTGTATYSLLGATSPTVSDGRIAPGTVTSGTLSVEFNSGFHVVNLINFGVQMSNHAYRLDGGTSSSSGPFFSFSPTVSSPTSCGSSGCNSLVHGFFAGTTAERAGISYHIDDFDALQDIIGAAAFKKN